VAGLAGKATRWRIALLGAACTGALTLLPQADGTVSATCVRDERGHVRALRSSLKPATIRIGPRQSVTWIACGAGSKRIESTSRPRAWTTFTLRPNSQKRIVFNRVGRYPYKVNAKVNGLVIVAVAGTGSNPPGQGANERTVRYDVRVEASYRYSQTLDGGLVQTAIDYVGTWPTLAVKIFDGFGTLTAVGRHETGRIDGKLTYSDARGQTRCAGTLDYPPYPATAALSGGRPKGQAPYFSFDSDVNDQGPYSDLTDQRLNSICDDLPASDARTVWLGTSFEVAQGVVVEPPGAGVGEFDAGFVRNGGTGIPFPLDRVRDHKAFTVVGSRTVASASCGAGCTEAFTGRVEFVFTPRR
jgi:plastocyanin